MFYGGHRRYLNSAGESSIDPPLEFKSKRQLKQLKLSRQRDSRNEERVSWQMNFQKNNRENNEETETNVKKFRKVANIVRNTITLDHFSSVIREDWTEEVRAGVKLWVNKETGEVATECPWEQHPTQTPIQRLLAKQKSKRNSGLVTSSSSSSGPATEAVFGTGSLVYEGKEVQELFELLDSVK
jgi:hypothetical protein